MTCLLIGIVLGPLLGGGPAAGREATAAPPLRPPSDTSRMERTLRHFYDLYTRREFGALYERAAPSLRQKGMTRQNFVGFMRTRRKRLGPAQSVEIRALNETADGTVRARTRVTYAEGQKIERWRLSVSGDSVQWHSFRTVGTPDGEPRAGPAGERVEVGAPVPTIEVASLRDSTRRLSPADFRGRHLLLNFWATWCAPCLQKIPTLRTAHRRYGEALAILNLSFDRSRSDVFSLLDRREMPGHHAFVGMDRFRQVLGQRFGIRKLPSLLLVGPEGQIVATARDVQQDGLLHTLAEQIGPPSDQ